MLKPYIQKGQSRVECEHCGYFWIESVTIEHDDVMLDDHEDCECPECGGAFDLDDVAANVVVIR